MLQPDHASPVSGETDAHAVTPLTVARALGLPRGLESMVEMEVTYTQQRLRSRENFSARVQSELDRLPLRPHHFLDSGPA